MNGPEDEIQLKCMFHVYGIETTIYNYLLGFIIEVH